MTLDRGSEIDAQWARWLDRPPEWLRGPGTRLVAGEDCRPDRVVLTVRPDVTWVRCHPTWAERLAPCLPDAEGVRALALARRLGLDEQVCTEREEVLYLDADRFRPAPSSAARVLGEADRDAFEALRAACAPREVELSEVELGQPLVMGVFGGDRLEGVASYLLPGGPIADVGILTHPERRGRGVATALASAVCHGALARGLIPQWWSLGSNRPSLGVASRLGFEHYAFEEGIRP